MVVEVMFYELCFFSSYLPIGEPSHMAPDHVCCIVSFLPFLSLPLLDHPSCGGDGKTTEYNNNYIVIVESLGYILY